MPLRSARSGDASRPLRGKAEVPCLAPGWSRDPSVTPASGDPNRRESELRATREWSNNFVVRIICNLTKSPLGDFYNLNHLNRQSADCINIFFIIKTSHLLYDSVFSTLEDPINL